MQTTVTPFFTPTQISGCQLWLDAADTATLTLSGTNVTQWNDKSGNRNNAQTTLGTPVLQSLNGIQGIYFATETEQMTTVSNAATLGSAARTMLCVIRAPSASSEVLIGCGNHTVGASPTSFGFHLEGPNSRLFAPYTYSTDNNIISFFSTAGMIVYADYNPSVNTVAGSYNGTSLQSRATATLATTTSPWYLGRRPDNNGCVTGYIYEVVHYSSVLSTAQRQQVEGYLAWKWNLQASLPANHPYKNSPIPPLLNPPTTLPLLFQTLTATFLPTQISGCQLWLDAADSTTLSLSGSNVTQWNDKSGNGRNATGYNTTATFNPNGLNTGYSALEFSATKSMQSPVPLGTFSSAVSGFIIYKFTGSVNLTAAYGLFSRTVSPSNGVPTPFDMYSFSNATYRSLGNGTVFTQSSVSPNYITQTNASQYNFSIQSSATTTWNESVNGTFVTLTTSGGTGAGYGDTGSNVMIGGRLDTAVFFQGVISEVILYNISITTLQRQQIEGYLAWKWGLQANLPTTHPYKAGPPYSAIIPAPSRSIVQPASWQPNQISGCSLWLDAADSSTLTLTGSNVTQWKDKSSSALIMSQTTLISMPTVTSNVLNKQPVVGFTTAQNMATLTNLTLGPAQSMFVVFNPLTTTNYFFMEQGPNINTTDGSFLYGSNGDLFAIRRTSSRYVYDAIGRLTPPFSANNWYVCSFVNSNVTTAVSDVYWSINGSQRAIAYNTFSNVLTGNTSAIMNLNPSGRVPASNYSAEIIIYTSALTVSQTQQVEGYLAWKWGLVGSLPANHPWKRWPPSP